MRNKTDKTVDTRDVIIISNEELEQAIPRFQREGKKNKKIGVKRS